MKIVGISDIHGLLKIGIPRCDVLCIAGDICPTHNHSVSFQKAWIQLELIPWLSHKISKKYIKHAIIVSGNHDFFFQDLIVKGEENNFIANLPNNIYYLRDNYVQINGINFYGTPWQPVFYDWAFNLSEIELDMQFEKIPNDMHVIIAHGPPYGYCDMISNITQHPITGENLVYNDNFNHLGSHAFTRHIARVKPNLVMCGHIHTGSHEIMKMTHDNNTETDIVNVSIVNEKYKKFFKPFQYKI